MIGTAIRSNRKVVVRADIDALPITEISGVPFSSGRSGRDARLRPRRPYRDGYAASVLLERQNQSFSGTVRISFSLPKRRKPLGAAGSLREGLLDDIDAAIGIIVDPYAAMAKIAVGAGPYTLACDTFDIIVTGNSAHAAKPSEGVEAIAVACRR
ncbi:hypothetical protein [Mesorhizobium sp. WSM3882]|uniref:hypothetical protein n=1 Tax=Mesorhizobium sp. WSM3882 TaxID=2029407 RepID=UPI001FD8734B|nr:hypothetical protein [Mesorhizobium sp. WSM3882]